MKNMSDKKDKKDRKRTPKQIAALFCVVLLISLYVITLIAACLDFPGAGKLFAACLLSTIGLPILLWLLIWFSGIWKNRSEEAENSMPHREE